MTQSLFPDDQHLGLLTDFYELTMAAGYHVHGLADQRATFELWVRRLPSCRNYLVVAGLEQAIHFLQHFRFAPEQVDYLRRHPTLARLPSDWFDRLAELRFSGDVWAMPEGTVAFAGEPLFARDGPSDGGPAGRDLLADHSDDADADCLAGQPGGGGGPGPTRHRIWRPPSPGTPGGLAGGPCHLHRRLHGHQLHRGGTPARRPGPGHAGSFLGAGFWTTRSRPFAPSLSFSPARRC